MYHRPISSCQVGLSNITWRRRLLNSLKVFPQTDMVGKTSIRLGVWAVLCALPYHNSTCSISQLRGRGNSQLSHLFDIRRTSNQNVTNKMEFNLREERCLSRPYKHTCEHEWRTRWKWHTSDYRQGIRRERYDYIAMALALEPANIMFA